MNRSEYLSSTKDRFFEIFQNDKTLDAFDCKPGIYRVFKFQVFDRNHPKLEGFNKVLIVTANWKFDEEEEFLEELEYLFDFTPLLINLEQSGAFNPGAFHDENYSLEDKIRIIFVMFQRHNIKINEIEESFEWIAINKIKSIVKINNTGDSSNDIYFNSRMLPFPNEREVENERNVVYVLKGQRNETIDSLLFPGYEVIEIESDNYRDAFNNEWSSINYWSLLDETRNRLGIRMADSVLIPGYYDIHTLKLEDPRLDSNDEPYGFDIPYQIIGIGRWMPLEHGQDEEGMDK